MRLIDADKLAEYIAENEQAFVFAIKSKDLTMLEDIILDIPTAYDVDKVVQRLDKASDYYECEEQGREHVQMIDLADAIEIVKAGGNQNATKENS